MANAAAAVPAAGETVPLNQLWMATDALAKTKQMRNYFQLERDKINAYWEITKKELEAIRAERRNKDREIEEMHERHKVEMKVYKQKARHLLYEHKVQIAQLKTESERALHNKLQEHRAKEADLKKDKRQLKQEWKGQGLQHDEQLFRMRQDYDKELTQLKQHFERKMKEMQMKYEKRIKNLREEMELKRKAEIDDIETRKTAHIKDLMSAHDRAFQDIREYYNDITSNNLELIKNLKDNVSTMKRNEAYNEKLMFEIAQENKRLTEPLTKALKEVNLLNHDLTNYEKDKEHLKSAKHRLQQLEDAYKTKEWEFEVLTQRFDAVKSEVDKLYEKYRGTVSNLQKNAMFRHVLLKKKVEVTSTQLEKKDAQLGEVIKASNLEAGTAATVERQLEDMLNDKNTLIEGLQRGLAEITERHEVMVNEYEAHLGDHGVKGLR